MKVLITDDVHPLLIAGFQERGWQVDYLPNITHQQTMDCIGQYQGLIINSKINVHKDFLAKTQGLKFIGRLGSGMEIVDIPATEALGVRVHSSPEGNCESVAEHALGMLLALANNICKADREVRNFDWRREENRGWELKSKTFGIIGYGHTGSALGQRLVGFGLKETLAYDKYKSAGYAASHTHVHETTLDAIMEKADIISFHLPLTAETRHLADAAFINTCKKGVVLVNTSRGQVIETHALCDALERGQVAGACMDVFENEKTQTFSDEEKRMYQRLYDLPNTVLTPHVAGWTQESKRRLSEILLDKIFKALD